jgi:hypothetical protein
MMSGEGKMTQYLIYQDRKVPDLQTRLKQALADFYHRFNTLPAEVVIHKSLVDQAGAALTALDLPRLPLRGSGGCLVGEVWLGIEKSAQGDTSTLGWGRAEAPASPAPEAIPR